MSPADIRKLADQYRRMGAGETEPVLRALADVVEAGNVLEAATRCVGAFVSVPSHLSANLQEALLRVEALKP